MTGDLAEFILSPSWAHRASTFACHIEPVPNYKIYDIEYSVQYRDTRVNDRLLRTTRYYEGHHPDRAIDRYAFIIVKQGVTL